jgi:hypothetical protein
MWQWQWHVHELQADAIMHYYLVNTVKSQLSQFETTVCAEHVALARLRMKSMLFLYVLPMNNDKDKAGYFYCN